MVFLDGKNIAKGKKINVETKISRGKHDLRVELYDIVNSKIYLLNVINPLLFICQFKFSEGENLILNNDYLSYSLEFEVQEDDISNVIELSLKNNKNVSSTDMKTDIFCCYYGDINVISELKKEKNYRTIERKKHIYILNTIFYVALIIAFIIGIFLKFREINFFEAIIVCAILMTFAFRNIYIINNTGDDSLSSDEKD